MADHCQILLLGVDSRRRKINWSLVGSNLKIDRLAPALTEKELKAIPKGKLESQARLRRYNLLTETCNEASIKSLVLGHSLERQISLSMYRFLRGGGIEGMAGFKAAEGDTESFTAVNEKIRLLRPFLGFPKV
jgi:tRNA(Ile)-lysidine synthase TilS/MesJ